MKLKLFLSLLLIVPIFLASPSKILAAACEIASWDPASRNLQACVGEFNSVSDLRGTIAEFECISNSNFPTTNPVDGNCYGVTGNTYNLSSIPNSEIAQDASGKFYTCISGQSMARAIGSIRVNFTGGQTCSTDVIITKPSDWNPLTEGLPFSSPSGRTGNSSECISGGAKGINTALGCISYDAVGGGFVRSLLGLAIGLGGGIALLLILYGVFIVTTSAGIPDKLKEGKEIISSAVAGLIFIILAIFLMNLVGIQILKIPGLQ